jgi:hypothetical protein
MEQSFNVCVCVCVLEGSWVKGVGTLCVTRGGRGIRREARENYFLQEVSCPLRLSASLWGL